MIRNIVTGRNAGRPGSTRWRSVGALVAVVGATALAISLFSTWRSAAIGTSGGPGPAAVADAAGNLSVPAGYRESYQYLGSWAVAADQGQGSKEIHTVYASPGLIAAFRNDGRFPDGSVLVKEVFETGTDAMTTGPAVSHSRTLKGWFVMVRDGGDSRPGHKLWGDGWGWSWFDAGETKKTTSTDYKVDCLSCHLPAKDTSWVFVHGYPPLAK